MVTENSPTGVVVGVDGSMSSLQAVDWAISEARGTGAPLHVLYAHQPPRSEWSGGPFRTRRPAT